MMKNTLLQCPVCSKALKKGEKQYFCSDRHSFDIARKGYVNLLLPRHTGAGDPGDSKEMLQSRRAFLDKGYYEGFSDQLNSIVTCVLPMKEETGESVNILDAGCGEGYYTWRLKNSLAALDSHRRPHIYGIDVSKHAIHYASGRDKSIRFAVASNYHIPILKGTLDCILCILPQGMNRNSVVCLSHQESLLLRHRRRAISIALEGDCTKIRSLLWAGREP